MDREVMRARDTMSTKFVELVDNGFWYSPEMDFVRNALDFSQKTVNGWVDLELYKGNVTIKGRYSPRSLYSPTISSMDVAGTTTPRTPAGLSGSMDNALNGQG